MKLIAGKIKLPFSDKIKYEFDLMVRNPEMDLKNIKARWEQAHNSCELYWRQRFFNKEMKIWKWSGDSVSFDR